ncbi:MAG TPA: RDD family protein [Anaerolineae bacterium]|nr:RDD family protein [Anaerolineae bacterium]MCB0180089.1 RDD family protein [Anaerolineae bacterium]MCB9105774.1 RDD family protein [Anaerolineales bacterium]HRV95925.1 RDD family protein [Anaerolineae bacterium]
MSSYDSFDQSMGRTTVEVIGFGRRFVAYFIDGILLWIILIALSFCAGLAISIASDPNEAIGLGLNCLVILISVGYFVGFWATTGQTPGKMAMGIKVIGVDGQPVSWGQAFIRYLGYIINSLAFSIGFLWIAFDAQRQGWHDKIAKTYVVRQETTFSNTDAITIVPSDKDGSPILAVILALIPVLIITAIVVIAILLLLGPVVGNVFSNIVENLETPVP